MNQTKKFINNKVVTVYFPFRSIENYKKKHENLAKEKGVNAQFQAARTFTQAKRILFG